MEFDEVLAMDYADAVLVARGEKMQTNHICTVD